MKFRPHFFWFVPLCLVIGVGLFWGLLPESRQYRLARAMKKAQTKIAALTGKKSELASISGYIGRPGVLIQALDSPSGWAACSDATGKFTLIEESCYPGAEIELVIPISSEMSQKVTVTLPKKVSQPGLFEIGRIPIERAKTVSTSSVWGRNAVSLVDYDLVNDTYYRNLFAKITEGKKTDQEKLTALNYFVAAKLNFDEATAEYHSPRQILERGSKYCGPLSLAMATLSRAGGYPTRMLHLRTGGPFPNFHAVVEIYYDQSWHVFDATYGITFLRPDGSVASYLDLRLTPELVTPETLKAIAPRARRSGYAWVPNASNSVFVFLVEPRDFDGISQWMPSLYSSGMFHEFYFRL
ncbi:MAG: transglutaminase-like domain-containing protein [Blastocatellia bacterium]|nr:transglutaminase-like domain-containing protein [Blastocatellia bacterium]